MYSLRQLIPVLNALLVFDEAGNKIDQNRIKKVEELTKQEVKRFKKEIKAKLAEGVGLEDYEMDYCDEWNWKYNLVDDD